jgi:S1-C subfamily serine protease
MLIYINGDPEPHQAEVVHIAHDCDLALIRPIDAARLEVITPLEFGELPRLGSTVDTLGYPAGGIQLSSTRGVVSRIEEQLYVHSGVDVHLTVQTDAAINPGSSGGPVIQNGLVVGVAFQANLNLENVGFVIPMEVISRFLRDVEDGSYDGYPELGIDAANLEHPAARAWAGLAEGESGVRVNRVYADTSAEGKIEVGDIILAVNGQPVANDGTVLDVENRIPFGMLIDRMFIGESASVRVLRDGERVDLDVPLLPFAQVDSQGHAYDQKPPFFVYGGLVFATLSRETLKTYGADWRGEAPKALLDEFLYRPVTSSIVRIEERVVLLGRLDHAVNAEIAWYRNQIVERVNGKKISGLADLVRALEQHEGEFHFLEFAHGRRFAVLDRRAVEAANAEILSSYGIPEDRYP